MARTINGQEINGQELVGDSGGAISITVHEYSIHTVNGIKSYITMTNILSFLIHIFIIRNI